MTYSWGCPPLCGTCTAVLGTSMEPRADTAADAAAANAIATDAAKSSQQPLSELPLPPLRPPQCLPLTTWPPPQPQPQATR